MPGLAGQLNLMPMYDAVYPEIRKHDKDTIVMYEPVTWGLMSNKQLLNTGFDHPPGHDPTRTALSWHYYCWIIQINSDPLKNGTYPFIDKVFCDSWQLNDYFNTIQADVATHLGNGPTFLTEFGICSILVPDQPDPHKFNNDECKYILNSTDAHLQSWTYWDENLYYRDTREINQDLVNLFSRVYPMATNGIPLSMSYDVDTRKFSYTFSLNATSLRRAALDTEIFVPDHVYAPNGFQVIASKFLTWRFDPQMHRLYFRLTSNEMQKIQQQRQHRYKEYEANILIEPK